MLQPSPRFTESSQLEFESTYAVFLEFGRAHTDWLIAIEMVASDGDLRDGMTSTYRDAYAVSLLEVRLTQQATGRVYEVMNKCLAGAVAGPDLFSDVIGTMRPFVDSFRYASASAAMIIASDYYCPRAF